MASEEADKSKLTPATAGVVLVILVVALAAYVSLAYALGVAALFGGSLVLFYWAGVEHLKLKALPSVVIGALGGIFNGSLFALLPPIMGEAGGALMALIVLLGAIYFLLLGWIPLVFNQAYMLLLTVVLIPSVLTQGQFVEMAVAVLYGGAFWGGVVLLGSWINNWRTQRAQLKRV